MTAAAALFTKPTMPSFRRELLFSLVIGALCVLLFFVDIAGVPQAPSGIRSRALVTAVDNSQVRTHLIVKTNLQQLQVRLLSGPHKGREIQVVNMLTGKLEVDEWYEPGTTILVEYAAPDGTPKNAVARGAHRLGLQLFLAVLFALLLVAVAGVTGLKAGLSFVFAALVLWRLFFPLLLRGYPPIPTGLGIVTLLTAVICFSVGGLTRRGLTTFLGSLLGLLLNDLALDLKAGLAERRKVLEPCEEVLPILGKIPDARQVDGVNADRTRHRIAAE